MTLQTRSSKWISYASSRLIDYKWSEPMEHYFRGLVNTFRVAGSCRTLITDRSILLQMLSSCRSTDAATHLQIGAARKQFAMASMNSGSVLTVSRCSTIRYLSSCPRCCESMPGLHTRCYQDGSTAVSPPRQSLRIP